MIKKIINMLSIKRIAQYYITSLHMYNIGRINCPA